MKKVIKEIIPYVIIVISAVLIRMVFLINANVPTGSMNDTIPTESRILGTKFAYWFSEPSRGDIVVFDAPEEDKLYVKRVIGVGGDKIEIRNESIVGGEPIRSAVWVNGKKLDEPYLKEKIWSGGEGVYEVPEGHIFCMGDNRNESFDARYWNQHYISVDKVHGKAYLLYWPLSEFHWLY